MCFNLFLWPHRPTFAPGYSQTVSEERRQDTSLKTGCRCRVFCLFLSVTHTHTLTHLMGDCRGLAASVYLSSPIRQRCLLLRRSDTFPSICASPGAAALTPATPRHALKTILHTACTQKHTCDEALAGPGATKLMLQLPVYDDIVSYMGSRPTFTLIFNLSLSPSVHAFALKNIKRTLSYSG